MTSFQMRRPSPPLDAFVALIWICQRKVFCRVRRLQRAIYRAHRTSAVNWAELAADVPILD